VAAAAGSARVTATEHIRANWTDRIRVTDLTPYFDEWPQG